MRIVILTENTTSRESLACEHGLSLYIEAAGKRILFDAGQTGIFADNAEKLGIDLSLVDLAVLSHGHYDHGGGLGRFLEINSRADIYLNRDCFVPHYNGTEKYIGLDSNLQQSRRLVFTEDHHILAPGLELYTANGFPARWPREHYGLLSVEDGKFVPDVFRHEQYLLIREGDRTVCVSGCSHKGVVNITGWFSPDVLIGGFHFMKLDPEGAGRAPLEQAAKALMAGSTVYYTGHCTGQRQYQFLKERMGQRLHSFSTGSEIILD